MFSEQMKSNIDLSVQKSVFVELDGLSLGHP